MGLSKESTLRQVLSNREGRKILEKHFGRLLNSPMINIVLDMRLEQIAKLAGNRIPPGLLDQIDSELRDIEY